MLFSAKSYILASWIALTSTAAFASVLEVQIGNQRETIGKNEITKAMADPNMFLGLSGRVILFFEPSRIKRLNFMVPKAAAPYNVAVFVCNRKIGTIKISNRYQLGFPSRIDISRLSANAARSYVKRIKNNDCARNTREP